MLGAYIFTFVVIVNMYAPNIWVPKYIRQIYSVRGCDGVQSTAERSYPTPEVRSRSREDPIPEGRRPRGATQCLRSGAMARGSYPMSKVRDSSRDCQAVTAQEQPRRATQTRGQGLRPGGATPCPRSGGCAGAGGPRGAIPCSRSGGVAVRRHPSSKVRSSGCAFLEQPWRDTPCPR